MGHTATRVPVYLDCYCTHNHTYRAVVLEASHGTHRDSLMVTSITVLVTILYFKCRRRQYYCTEHAATIFGWWAARDTPRQLLDGDLDTHILTVLKTMTYFNIYI
jgi:hypothetical protein